MADCEACGSPVGDHTNKQAKDCTTVLNGGCTHVHTVAFEEGRTDLRECLDCEVLLKAEHKWVNGVWRLQWMEKL